MIKTLLFLLDAELGLVDALLHDLQFVEGVGLLCVELGDAGDLVDDLPAGAGGHVDDLGHVALHDDVVALGGDARLREQVLDVREVDRALVEVVVRVVVVRRLLDAALDSYLLDAADSVGAGGVDDL